MTWVKSRVIGLDGKPIEGRCVKATLMTKPGWLANATGKVVGRVTDNTDTAGLWRMNLLPASTIETSGGTAAYVQINEGGEPPDVYYIRVPDTQDPNAELWARDLMINPDPGNPVFNPFHALSRLSDVDRESVMGAEPGHYLCLLPNGLWGATPGLLPLMLFWEPDKTDLLAIQYRVSGFGGQGARVGFGDGSAEVVVTTSEIHTHRYAGPGTYIMTAADIAYPAFNTKIPVGIKDHLPRLRVYLDADDDWKVLAWLDEPADDTVFAVSWGDGSPIEEHAGQRLERVPPRPRVPHTYTKLGVYEVLVTDLSTKRQTIQQVEIGEIGIMFTYDSPDRPRTDMRWMAVGARWEIERDGFLHASGTVPASGRVSHPALVDIGPGDFRVLIREVIATTVRRSAVRRYVHPTQWDWRMKVEMTWRSSSDPQGKQTVTVVAKEARTKCTLEWGDGSPSIIVDPGQLASHLYTLPAPSAGWRLRLTETQIADPRTFTRVLGEPRRVGTPVLTARTQGSVDLDVLGIDQDYNDDWYSISWDVGADAEVVGAVGRWFPATHVYPAAGHKIIQLDGPGMAAPIRREVDVTFYPSPVLSVVEARDNSGHTEDPTRRTARISVDNSQSGGKCTVILGDGSTPRVCEETETFTYQYGTDVNGVVYVIASSNADPTAKARVPVTVPFGAERTLYYTVTPVSTGDPNETYKAKVTITAKETGRAVGVQWDIDGQFQQVPPNDEIEHLYDLPETYTIGVKYQDSTTVWPTDVTIPMPLGAVISSD